MGKAYLLVIFLLTASFIGCMDSEDDELLDVRNIEDVYITATKLIVDSFNDALYESICESLMYEDGTLYRQVDVEDCIDDATDEYTRSGSSSTTAGSSSTTESNAMVAPDWEYMEFANTGKRAEFTGDIYRITGVGIYCDEHNDCDAIKIREIYMAKNTQSKEWGYASQGFSTTDGLYLEVIDIEIIT